MTEVTQSNKPAVAMCFLCMPRSSETSFSLIPGIFGFYLPPALEGYNQALVSTGCFTFSVL
jgi:hypothetical protein